MIKQFFSLKFWSISILYLVLSGYVFGQTYQWEEISGFPGLGRDDAVAFTIDETIYIGSGNHSGFYQSNLFYSYNVLSGNWSEIAVFPGVARQYARSESIGGKAYLIGGIDAEGNPLNDIWEYDPIFDSWIEKTNFPGGNRWQAASFTIDDMLYFGTGRGWDVFYHDFWKYNPVNDEWTEVAGLPKLPSYESVSFSLYDSGYLGLGRDCTGVYLNDFWQYQPSTDEWVEKAEFPGDARYYAKAESFSGLGFVGTGQNEFGQMLNDFWSYDPIKDAWNSMPELPAERRRGLASCSIPFRGAYFICGLNDSFNRLKDVYQLSVSVQEDVKFKIYINTSNQLLYATDITENSVLNIFDINGRLIHHFEAIEDHLQIDISSWSSGLYLVAIDNQTEKVIIAN